MNTYFVRHGTGLDIDDAMRRRLWTGGRTRPNTYKPNFSILLAKGDKGRRSIKRSMVVAGERLLMCFALLLVGCKPETKVVYVTNAAPPAATVVLDTSAQALLYLIGEMNAFESRLGGPDLSDLRQYFASLERTYGSLPASIYGSPRYGSVVKQLQKTLQYWDVFSKGSKYLLVAPSQIYTGSDGFTYPDDGYFGSSLKGRLAEEGLLDRWISSTVENPSNPFDSESGRHILAVFKETASKTFNSGKEDFQKIVTP